MNLLQPYKSVVKACTRLFTTTLQCRNHCATTTTLRLLVFQTTASTWPQLDTDWGKGRIEVSHVARDSAGMEQGREAIRSVISLWYRYPFSKYAAPISICSAISRAGLEHHTAIGGIGRVDGGWFPLVQYVLASVRPVLSLLRFHWPDGGRRTAETNCLKAASNKCGRRAARARAGSVIKCECVWGESIPEMLMSSISLAIGPWPTRGRGVFAMACFRNGSIIYSARTSGNFFFSFACVFLSSQECGKAIFDLLWMINKFSRSRQFLISETEGQLWFAGDVGNKRLSIVFL